jgi:tetraacyldisaccharide 4'-kinase
MGDLAGWHRRLVEAGSRTLVERLLLALLIPLSWLYGLAVAVRAALFRSGLRSVYRASVPVISVGNLAVGGTGKTPVVDDLVKRLQRRGVRVAVVSRGYGGKGVPGDGLVCAGNGPLVGPGACGDEPFLLARRNPGALILAHPRRAQAVQAAVEVYGAEVVVLDDGFQHLAVARDLDLVLLDARRPLSNGRVLPAGRLREFPRALARADLLVMTRCNGQLPGTLFPGRPTVHCRHVLDRQARPLAGAPCSLANLAEKPAVAFAGIADPEGFFASLRQLGLSLLATISLSDHLTYDRLTLEGINRAAEPAEILVTTEKDGVKLRAGDFRVPCFEVPVTIVYADEEILEAHLDRLLIKDAT